MVGRLAGSAAGVMLLDRVYTEAASYFSYLDQVNHILIEEAPDMIFCAHQRSLEAVPIMIAARRKIPTATFIYSWDNLPKGEMAVRTDHYLVWSARMKEDLLKYYPSVAGDRVHIVGTPQFEHYFDSSLVKDRCQFLRRLGLDDSRPIVCYSGGAEATAPNEPAYLADLAYAMRRVRAQTRPQIIFRRCPVDHSDRYDNVLRQYPEIIVSDPVWASFRDGDWTQVVPTMEDVALLANLAHHCDLVVNVGSTMAMDFAVLGKPSIYVNYDLDNVTNDNPTQVSDVYRLPHFRSVHELQPVYWATSPQQLGNQVLHALSHPTEKLQARRDWLDQQALAPLDQASSRCHKVLRQIAGR
jgi:hypothetical protein